MTRVLTPVVKYGRVNVECIHMRSSSLGNARALWLTVLTATLLVVTACSSSQSDPFVPDESAITATTAANLPTQDASTTTAAEADVVEPIEGDDAPEQSDVGNPGSVPVADEPPPGSFIILEEEVLPLVDAVVPRLDRPSGPAYADGAGGLVFQPPWGVDDVVFHIGPEGNGPAPLLDIEGGRLLRLWGATTDGDAPRLLATVLDNADSVDQVETLLWWDREAKERWVATIGDSSTRVDHVDYGQGRYVIDKTTSDGSSFVFLNEDGETVELPTNPKPLCREAVMCRRLPVLSPGGSRLAFHDPATSKVVVLELDLAEEVAAVELPDGTEVASLDLSERFLVINHALAGEAQPAFVVDLDAVRPEMMQLAVSGDVFLGVVGSG